MTQPPLTPGEILVLVDGESSGEVLTLMGGGIPGNTGPQGPKGDKGDPGDGGGITEHVGQADPHPQYATEAYLDTRISSHESDTTPHAVYDDGPSFSLLYQNAKV